jgi:hypothetical protein
MFRIQEARVALNRCLVSPREFSMSLFYKDDTNVQAWEIAVLENDVRIVCVPDFENSMWGLMVPGQSNQGSDDGWYLLLEDAFFQSGNWNGRYPADYEVA